MLKQQKLEELAKQAGFSSFNGADFSQRLQLMQIAATLELDSSIMEVDRTLSQILNAMPE